MEVCRGAERGRAQVRACVQAAGGCVGAAPAARPSALMEEGFSVRVCLCVPVFLCVQSASFPGSDAALGCVVRVLETALPGCVCCSVVFCLLGGLGWCQDDACPLYCRGLPTVCVCYVLCPQCVSLVLSTLKHCRHVCVSPGLLASYSVTPQRLWFPSTQCRQQEAC